MDQIDNYGLSKKIKYEFDKLGFFTGAVFCDTSKWPENLAFIGFREDYMAYAVWQIKDSLLKFPFEMTLEISKMFQLYMEKNEDILKE